MDFGLLQTVNNPEAVSPSDYQPPVDYSEPIKNIGDQVVRVIDGKFKDSTGAEDPFRLGKTKNGDLSFEVALEVVDGTYKGKRLYDRVNLGPFKNGKGNSAFNFLMAFGNTAPLTQPLDYVKAMDRAIKGGNVTKTFVSMEWYSNPKSKEYQGTGKSIKYEEAKALGIIHEDGIRITEPDTNNVLLAKNVMSKYRAHTLGQAVA